jgi:hypothetical protein
LSPSEFCSRCTLLPVGYLDFEAQITTSPFTGPRRNKVAARLPGSTSSGSVTHRGRRLGFPPAQMKRPPPRANEEGPTGGGDSKKGKGRWGGRRRNEQRLGSGRGGGALSLAAFANAKSRSTGYNPALISEYHLYQVLSPKFHSVSLLQMLR